MGIDYDSHLIVGWVVNGDMVRRSILESGKPNCCTPSSPDRVDDKEDQKACVCSYCIKSCLSIPEGWQVISSYPYFDCDPSEYVLALSLDGISPSGMTKASVLKELLSDDELISRGREWALTHGSTEAELDVQIFSLAHIW